MPETPVLQMRNINKYYTLSGVKANDSVNFSVNRGEIHALVGENGAGKSTLMKILNGIETADDGDILINGEEVRINSPRTADDYGIGMVHQHFRLFKDFTVTQNVLIGNEPVKRGIYDRKRGQSAVAELIKENGFNLNPRAKVSSLSISQMQQIEIVRMLYNQDDILILDEPTSVLTEQEVKNLFGTLRKLISQNKTIILITHKLSEVMNISDRITIMRSGKIVGVKNTDDVDKKEISRLMIGADLISVKTDRTEISDSRIVYQLKDICLKNGSSDVMFLDSITFNASAGEIVGITGAAGNGLRELEDILSGFRIPSSGKILHDDEEITGFTTRELRRKGLSYVPADRLKRGVSLCSSIYENIMISEKGITGFAGILKRERIRKHAEKLITDHGIDGKPDSPIGTLSGGNIQKVILARELELADDFVLFSEPTWGLDVASSNFIYGKINEMKKKGAAVILLSSNLDEVLSLSDRVLVMYRGKITGKFENKNLNRELLGEYMLGLKDDFN